MKVNADRQRVGRNDDPRHQRQRTQRHGQSGVRGPDGRSRRPRRVASRRAVDSRRRRFAGGLLRARPDARPERDDAQRHDVRRLEPAARRERLDVARHQRRTTCRAATSAAACSTSVRAAGSTTSSARRASTSTRRKCSGPTPPRAPLGQQYRNLSVGGLLLRTDPDGQVVLLRRVSARAGDRSDLQSLLNTDALGLQAAGARPRFRVAPAEHPRTGRTSRRPSAASRAPASAIRRSLFGTLDFTPPSSTTGQAFNSRSTDRGIAQDPSGIITTELPRTAASERTGMAAVQGQPLELLRLRHSERDVGRREPDARIYGTPFVDLPNGSRARELDLRRRHARRADRRVRRQPGDEHEHRRRPTAQAMNTLSWFSENNKHRLKLTTRAAPRRLRAGLRRPTSSARSASTRSPISPPAGRRRSRAQLTPRARSDGAVHRRRCRSATPTGRRTISRFSTACASTAIASRSAPTYNPRRRAAFGVRNDHVPNKLYVSPRIGFSWTYGTAPQIAAFEGAVRGPRAVVRGGIGIFQSTPNAQLDRRRARQHRACRAPCSSSPASASRRRRRTGPRTRRASSVDSHAVRRRHDGHRVREHGAERRRCSPRTIASPRALRSNLQWSGPILDNRFIADGRRDVFAEPEPGEHVRPELQARCSSSPCRTRAAARCTRSRRASCRRPASIASRDARVTRRSRA